MKPHLAALAFAFALSALVPAAMARDDDLDTRITLGRLQVLVERAGEVVEGVRSEPQTEDVDPAALYAALYRTWLNLEALRGEACAAGVLERDACAARFEPDWLRPPGGPAPTLAQVSQWSDALQDEVLAIVGPICALAPPDAEGPGACSVE